MKLKPYRASYRNYLRKNILLFNISLQNITIFWLDMVDSFKQNMDSDNICGKIEQCK